MRLNRRLSKRLTQQKPIKIMLKRDEKEQLGIRMDVELNILEAEPLARKCGIRVGMKILTFCDVDVRTLTSQIDSTFHLLTLPLKQITHTHTQHLCNARTTGVDETRHSQGSKQEGKI